MTSPKLQKYSNKMGRQLNVGSLAAKVLIGIADTAKFTYELLKELEDSEFNRMFTLPSWHERYPKYHSAKDINKGLWSLERGGYIKRKDKQTVFLTKKGMAEIIKFSMRNKRLEKPWDGKWRLIVFDIKETTRKDRDYLRRQLKWIGFEELQKSVWVFPYDIKDELKEFIRLCKFDFTGDVRFITAEKIDPDTKFRENFGLR